MPQPLICLMFVTDIGGEMLKATPSYFVKIYAKVYRVLKLNSA